MIARRDPPRREERNGLELSTDPERLDPAAIHDFLSNHSYWAAGIPIGAVRRAIDHSICTGLYDRERQIGFARLVTDTATFAWLADVYVLPGYRGRGLGVWLVDFTLREPAIDGLKRVLLGTRDAHDLYRRFGFDELPVGSFLEKRAPNPYPEQPKR